MEPATAGIEGPSPEIDRVRLFARRPIDLALAIAVAHGHLPHVRPRRRLYRSGRASTHRLCQGTVDPGDWRAVDDIHLLCGLPGRARTGRLVRAGADRRRRRVLDGAHRAGRPGERHEGVYATSCRQARTCTTSSAATARRSGRSRHPTGEHQGHGASGDARADPQADPEAHAQADAQADAEAHAQAHPQGRAATHATAHA